MDCAGHHEASRDTRDPVFTTLAIERQRGALKGTRMDCVGHWEAMVDPIRPRLDGAGYREATYNLGGLAFNVFRNRDAAREHGDETTLAVGRHMNGVENQEVVEDPRGPALTALALERLGGTLEAPTLTTLTIRRQREILGSPVLTSLAIGGGSGRSYRPPP